MPLWKLQTVGSERLNFLYDNLRPDNESRELLCFVAFVHVLGCKIRNSQAVADSRRGELGDHIRRGDGLKMFKVQGVNRVHAGFGCALEQEGIVNRSPLNSGSGRLSKECGIFASGQADGFEMIQTFSSMLKRTCSGVWRYAGGSFVRTAYISARLWADTTPSSFSLWIRSSTANDRS